MQNISKNDLQIIRDVAKQQFEISQSDRMAQLKKDWFAHNTFKGSRPMIHIELGTFNLDVVPPLLKCEDPNARRIEFMLYEQFVNHTLFNDDFIVRDYYPVRYNPYIKLFDLDIEIEETGGLGHQFKHQIIDIKDEFHKFEKPSTYVFDKEQTLNEINFYNELFGDILPAKLEGQALYSVPTQKVVHLMGMENMLFAMYDYPDEFKAMMDRIADEYINYFDHLAKNEVLLPTLGLESVGQGSWCHTDELPESVSSSRDIWGFLDSQETVNVSPDMFGEFVFPCYEKIAKHYGLLSYGCCEPVDPIFDKYLSKLSNLRKLSISPWCNEEMMGERLRGKNIVYHRKPSPNYLGVDVVMDEAVVTEHIDRTLKAAKGCAIEFTQRDVYTIHGNPEKVRRYVEIIRERSEVV